MLLRSKAAFLAASALHAFVHADNYVCCCLNVVSAVQRVLGTCCRLTACHLVNSCLALADWPTAASSFPAKSLADALSAVPVLCLADSPVAQSSVAILPVLTGQPSHHHWPADPSLTPLPHHLCFSATCRRVTCRLARWKCPCRLRPLLNRQLPPYRGHVLSDAAEPLRRSDRLFEAAARIDCSKNM